MDDSRIRAEQGEDLSGVRQVHTTSFPTPAEADLVDALRAAGRLTISLVAEVDGELVGHIGFSPVTLADTSDGLGLAPVAVLPEHRRRGIAGALIRRGLELCRRRGAGFVVVLGDPDYYRRFGFAPAGGRGLRDEYGGGDAFQVLELREGAIPSSSGLVRYAPEFAELD